MWHMHGSTHADALWCVVLSCALPCCAVLSCQVDPSAPNILNVPFIGDNVLAKLRRPFWTELQSRYGNMFYVRERVSRDGRGRKHCVSVWRRRLACSAAVRGLGLDARCNSQAVALAGSLP